MSEAYSLAMMSECSAINGPDGAGNIGDLRRVDEDNGGGRWRMHGDAKERAVVDRIVDGKHAVLLIGDGEVERVVPVSALPEGVGEGKALRVRFAGSELVFAIVDEGAQEAAAERVASKMDLLRRRGSRLAKRDEGE